MPHTPVVRRALAALAAVAILITGGLVSAGAAAAAPPPIARMAALGDSITQASMTCRLLVVCPTNSWSTGSEPAVASLASRVRASGSPSLIAFDDAVPGATSADLAKQVPWALAQHPQLVTVLIGANDACAGTVAAMTPTATFDANVRGALSSLAADGRQIFVASIPNLSLMYEVNKSSAAARLTWAITRTCQSLLASPTSTATVDVQRRSAVQQRVNEYNLVLQQACTDTPGCVFDGFALANTTFTASDISTKDYFHPSLSGQAKLAAVTSAALGW